MVSLNFKARVPVFDANVGVGHRHDRVSPFDSPDELLEEMARHGVDRALIYHLQGEILSPIEGNEALGRWAAGRAEFSLQWTLGPTPDSLRQLQQLRASGQLHSARLSCTGPSGIPFSEWIYGEALAWLAAERIPLWISLADTPAAELMETLNLFPELATVLLGGHYSHALLLRPLLRRLPKAHLELSRYECLGEVEELLGEFGASRLLYGSFYPRYAMGPMLYYLHHLRCGDAELAALCAGNLERLLGREAGR
ncbi:MAG: hypothetical protein HYW07_01520 [Candidatus Latescibacteria bacterium]|nr:hypothetical protein [Candidatus Latescibacterota bacterium]